MRKLVKVLAVVSAIFAIGAQQRATAGFIGAPMGLRGAIQHIKFDNPALPPMAFRLFCLQDANECKPHRMMFRGGLKLTGSVGRNPGTSIRM